MLTKHNKSLKPVCSAGRSNSNGYGTGAPDPNLCMIIHESRPMLSDEEMHGSWVPTTRIDKTQTRTQFKTFQYPNLLDMQNATVPKHICKSTLWK